MPGAWTGMTLSRSWGLFLRWEHHAHRIRYGKRECKQHDWRRARERHYRHIKKMRAPLAFRTFTTSSAERKVGQNFGSMWNRFLSRESPLLMARCCWLLLMPTYVCVVLNFNRFAAGEQQCKQSTHRPDGWDEKENRFGKSDSSTGCPKSPKSNRRDS